MKNIILKEKHLGTVIDRILAANRQVLYTEKILSEYGDNMPNHEKKEYVALLNNYNTEFEDLKKYILELKGFFDSFLSEYNTNVDEFLS